MEKGRGSLFGLDRKKYTQLMATSLPVLRASLGLSQADLAEIIGVTRQTLSAAESGTRELSWGNFISLLYVFTQNERSAPLVQTLGICTPELESVFRVAEIDGLRASAAPGNKKGAGESE